MSEFFDFLLHALSQFAGGTGSMENNLVRFGLTAILWGTLFFIAWGRLREHDLPREKLLLWGFGLGAVSAILMAGFVSVQMLEVIERKSAYTILVPLERALAMASVIVVAGAFLRYILDDARLARIYILVGLGISGLSLAIALWQWPRALSTLTEAQFHTTWSAWLFVVPLSILIIVAIVLLRRNPGWLAKVVTVALLFFLFSEVLDMINFATGKSYNHILCPIGNSLRILAIPLLGYVYLREQGIEKKQIEKDLEAYRLHLEELVEERTAELTAVNTLLKQEIQERKLAEEALARLNERYELILESAGEGIFGIDQQGQFIFVNRAAADMLGYGVDELIGQSCHATLHHSRVGGDPYPEDTCPMVAGYIHGIASQGDEEYFWRKDNTSFPVRYVSNLMHKDGSFTGTVVIFRDITYRKRAEAEIAQQNASLAAQNTIAAVLSRSLELRTILETALDTVLSVVEMDFGLVFLQDPATQELALQIYRGKILQDVAIKTERNWSCCMAISGEAMSNMRTVVHTIADYPDTYPESNFTQQGLQMLVSVPLISKNLAMGALTLGSQRTNRLQQSTSDLLTSIGQKIAMAIENAHLYQEAERRARELALLHQVSIALTSTFDTVKIYDQVTEQSVRLLDSHTACILAWDEAGQRVDLLSGYGTDEVEADLLRAGSDASGCVQDLITTVQSVAIDDAETDLRVPLLWRERLGVRALLCIPIRGTEDLPGTLLLMDRQAPRHWRLEEIELIESFVNRAALALVNARLHKQLEWAAALEERQRIAADMHDGLAQTVSLLGLQLDDVKDLIVSHQDRQALEALSNMRDVIEQLSIDVRRSISSLQGAPQPIRSLQDLLSELPTKLPEGGGPEVRLIFKITEPLFLQQEQTGQVILIVQEALLNAYRHAHAQSIKLRMEPGEGEVRIIVEDDGIGFDPEARRENSHDHFGLGIIRSRAARLGASLTIDSTPGQGTRLNLILPLSVNVNHIPFSAQQQASPCQDIVTPEIKA